MTVTGYWLDEAACIHADSAQFHAKNATGQQKAIATWCATCPVRAECLADALATPSYQDFGVRGGLRAEQRRDLRQRTDLPTGRDAMTIAALRRLLDEEHPIHPQPAQPEAAPRQPRKETTVNVPAERPAPAKEPADADPLGEVLDLLIWGDAHDDPAIRKLAAAASEALAALRQRRTADDELHKVEREAKELRERLTELDARAKKLRPAAAGKPVRDYEPAVVRAWAREREVPCPGVGQIPKAVLEAWRARDTF